MRKFGFNKFFIIVLAFTCGVSAFGNVGIPVVFFGFPFMIVNLIFVVLIESWVLKVRYKELATAQIIKQVFLVNLLTTFIGYPLVAGIEALGPIFGTNFGWLLPYQDLPEMHFYIGFSMCLTLLPCYFLSVWIEGKWLKKFLSKDISWKNIYLANLASYVFLLLQVFTQFPIHLMTYGKYTYEYFYKVLTKILSIFIGKT